MSIQRWECIPFASDKGSFVDYADHLAALEEAQVTGFREGFNAHAASRAKSEQMFGTYQHGSGENP